MPNLNEVTHVVTERGIFVKIAFWLIAQKLARTIPHPEWKPESGFEYVHPAPCASWERAKQPRNHVDRRRMATTKGQ
jgi:hypothetical protein